MKKYIQTELGTEKLCLECGEYWPLDEEFWFHRRSKVKKDGTYSTIYFPACKCCYNARYRPQRSASQYPMRSSYEDLWNVA
ncbi:hypothetical protein [Acinetobacter sp. CAAS 2-6]|uniref:hypothetical protein n=1 Tax=Acinetobacter sp. CAAS 2-6 TaxID=3016358 RepID=UPI002DD6AA26|nr:hypothetical protein [Acinetobacter sp. CAAS 2-6]